MSLGWAWRLYFALWVWGCLEALLCPHESLFLLSWGLAEAGRENEALGRGWRRPVETK